MKISGHLQSQYYTKHYSNASIPQGTWATWHTRDGHRVDGEEEGVAEVGERAELARGSAEHRCDRLELGGLTRRRRAAFRGGGCGPCSLCAVTNAHVHSRARAPIGESRRCSSSRVTSARSSHVHAVHRDAREFLSSTLYSEIYVLYRLNTQRTKELMQ